MDSWTDGYVTDIDYTDGYYRDLSPARLQFSLLLQGFRPPELDRNFAYAELGCGHAISATVHAAATGTARLFAMDFNAAFIADAQARANAAGLDSLKLSDNSFEEYLDADLPQLDAVTMHGVWSWVSPENRLLLTEFLRRRLKPGGYVFVSYNCLPGWTPMMPLQVLLSRGGEGADTVRRIETGMAFAERLQRVGAGYFQQNPLAGKRLAELQQQPPTYIAHEYMNRDWQPMYHFDVAQQLDAGKLRFAGTADLLGSVDRAAMSAEQLALLQETPDGPWRETVRDFLAGTHFRRDLFVRGGARLKPVEQVQRLRNTRFALLVPPSAAPARLTTSRGTIEIPPAAHLPVLQLLQHGPLSLAAICAERIDTLDMAQAVEAVTLLVGAGYIAPCLPEAGLAERRAACDRLNKVLLEAVLEDGAVDVLASPVIGAGVPLTRPQRLFLLAIQRNYADVAGFAWAVLSQLGRSVMKDGAALQTDEENLAELRAQEAAFRAQMLPLLRGLGIV